MPKNVIIVAGGQGSRMRSQIPKQFLILDGKPVLMHTINRFFQYNSDINVILVLPAPQISYWNELCATYNFSLPHKIAEGGVTRFHSVKNGIELIESGELTAVHDGVRPFVSLETITRCFDAATLKGSAIPVTKPVESIRKVEGENSYSCFRDEFRMVQTPQVFNTSLLKKGYEQPYNELFTDDASVIETMGNTIHLVEGNRENIKITSPLDLVLGEAIFQLKMEN